MRILIVPNSANPSAVAAATELVSWLSGAGFEPLLSDEDARACGVPSYGEIAPRVEGDEIRAPLEGVDLVVALGGDGTILKAVHLLGPVEVPVLGVNFGRLGFLAGAQAESLRASVEAALAGEGWIERRATLEAVVTSHTGAAQRYRALNEVYLGRGGMSRVVDADVAINGTPMARMRCDGVIVATSTGSTAYALSAGGPIVSPEVACALVLPVAPHTLLSRAIVAGPSDHIEIHLPNPARSNASIAIDGAVAVRSGGIRSITIARGADDVLLVKLDGRGFFEAVKDEFLGRP